MAADLVEHFFRHTYGQLVASLTRRVGVQHLEAIEDAAQSALQIALERWKVGGPPDNPTAWLFRVAQHELGQALRTRAGRDRLLAHHGEVLAPAAPEDPDAHAHLAAEVHDDLLRMLFVCCDEALPVGAQLVLALKTLCGFSVGEIAVRLFLTEATVYKRLSRARARLRQAAQEAALTEPSPEALVVRRPAVHHVLYLLFTEGYLASHATHAIRQELCDEALRLARLLATPWEPDAAAAPETAALIALMHLHRARLPARQDATGGLLLLEEQDRALWDPAQLAEGLAWLARSATGDTFSRYHAEAAIAAEHGLAPSLADTNWPRVVELYTMLDAVAPSPVHRLNRAVAVAAWRGPEVALAELEAMQPPTWLAGSYQWSAVLADLHARAGRASSAARYRELALASAPTEAIRALLARRLSAAPHPSLD